MKPRHFSNPEIARSAGLLANRHTPARVALMARLAERNKGRKVPDDPRRGATLDLVYESIEDGQSVAWWAAWAGVSPRTLRRWLAGQTWPDTAQIDRRRARLDELNRTN